MGRKERKSISTKSPPVPTDSHAEIEDWIVRLVMPEMHSIVERVDRSIRETIPGLQYAIKWKYAYYGLPELGWIIEMAAYAGFVNVFDPPPPLGTRDRSRYVKLMTLEEAQRRELHEWIEQAARVPGWG